MKIEAEQWRMVVALLLVAVIAASLLAITNMLTREPIAEAQRQAMMRSLMQVLPEHSNNPLSDTLEDDGARYYLARNDEGKLLALAWQVVAPNGYSGSIRVLIGITPQGKTIGVRVTDHRETPGLGDGITRNQAWIDSFAGHTLESRRWAVKKDGGDIDQFTGATISPRAVVNIVHQALQHYRARKDSIMKQSKPRGKP